MEWISATYVHWQLYQGLRNGNRNIGYIFFFFSAWYMKSSKNVKTLIGPWILAYKWSRCHVTYRKGEIRWLVFCYMQNVVQESCYLENLLFHSSSPWQHNTNEDRGKLMLKRIISREISNWCWGFSALPPCDIKLKLKYSLDFSSIETPHFHQFIVSN